MLGPTTVLVPAPRSTPSVKDMHWPALRICQELADRGLCHDVARLLERYAPIRKSATSGRAQRPSPDEHAVSLRCADRNPAPDRITIVDDVVTRGATLLACAWSVAERFPAVTLHGLAVVRTMSQQDVAEVRDSIEHGRIYLQSGSPRREP
jgi:predicted amidophosphoribosyltransferase